MKTCPILLSIAEYQFTYKPFTAMSLCLQVRNNSTSKTPLVFSLNLCLWYLKRAFHVLNLNLDCFYQRQNAEFLNNVQI